MHTPEPWLVRFTQMGYAASIVVKRGKGYPIVATLPWMSLPKEEGIANAQLMAGAADLLEACKEAANYLWLLFDWKGPQEGGSEMLDMLKEAIDKATQ